MSQTETDKYITTFVARSPLAAQVALEAIRAAGHALRAFPGVRGINIATMEAYEGWQTSMPVAELELIAVECNGAIDDIAPTAHGARQDAAAQLSEPPPGKPIGELAGGSS